MYLVSTIIYDFVSCIIFVYIIVSNANMLRFPYSQFYFF